MMRIDLGILKKQRQTKLNLPVNWYTLISTFFFVGKFPKMPGTAGSLICMPIYFFVLSSSVSYEAAASKMLFLLIVCTLMALPAITKFQKVTNTYDHSYIVIDEVIGQFLTLCICTEWLFYIGNLLPITFSVRSLSFFSAFILFRYFDIHKPLIIGYVNNHFKGAMGVILDDVLAALAASGVVYVIYHIFRLFY